MASPDSVFKTPSRTPRSEFKTPTQPTFQTTPLSYSKLSYSSFLRRDQSFSATRASRTSDSYLNQSTDRFIPNRRLFDPEMSNLILTSKKKPPFSSWEQRSNVAETRLASPLNDTSPPRLEQFTQRHEYYAWSEKSDQRKEYKARVMTLMMDNKRTLPRVLNLSSSIKKAEPHKARAVSLSEPLTKRHIPRFPEKILDMPMISEEFGSNVMDWSRRSHEMVVCLSNTVFCWHPVTKRCRMIPVRLGNVRDNFKADSKMAAVAFDLEAKRLAMSSKSGALMLYKFHDGSLFSSKALPACPCSRSNFSTYCSSFAWQPASLHNTPSDCLFVGKTCGCVLKVSIENEVAEEVLLGLGHRHIRCISFSCTYTHLAVLSMDGYLSLVSWSNGVMDEIVEWRVHEGTSVTLAWCPWQPSYLATAGIKDHLLRVWNCKKQEKIVEKSDKFPVTCITWFELHKELITGHSSDATDGDFDNYVQIWKFPKMELLCRLVGHRSKILYIGTGLNNSLLVTLGGDETMMLWRCFCTFVCKDNKWVEEETSDNKEKENISPTKRLLSACFSPMNRFNPR